MPQKLLTSYVNMLNKKNINDNFSYLKTLGKTLVALQVIITTFLTVSVLVPNPTHRGLNQCLGNFMPHFFQR